MTLRLRSSGQMPSWFGIPFMLGGLLFAGIGGVIAMDELRYGSDGVAVVGTVTDLDFRPGSGDDSDTWTIRYQFTDTAGFERYGFTDVSEDTFEAAALGGPIEITFLPAESGKNRVGSPDPQLLLPVVFIGAGLLFAAIGVGLLFLVRAMKRNQLPAWVQVTTEGDDEPDLQAAAALGKLIGGTGIASAIAPGPEPAPALQAAPLTEDELRALDARLAPPPVSPPPDEPPAAQQAEAQA